MSAAASGPAAVAVLGVGATSAIGYGTRTIQVAMAAGLRNFQESGLVGDDGQPARMSRLPDIDPDASRSGRVAQLTRYAVADLVNNAKQHLQRPVPVFVGLGDDNPASDLDAIGRALSDAPVANVREDSSPLSGYRGGRIAFLVAISRAMNWLNDNGADAALVVSADTRCTWHAAHALMRERRLLTDQDDGTIPGEGAVAILITPVQSPLARQHARFVITAPAFGADDFEKLRQAPQATDGLARSFRAIREHPVAGAHRATAVVTFATGELFFTRAFATGYLRNAELMPEPLQHDGIASNVGDTGAAAAGMALVRADGLMRQPESGDAHRILIYGHADDGRCAATMLIGTAGAES